MEKNKDFELMVSESQNAQELATTDPGASPFQLVIDPAMRYALKKALFDLIDSHDASLADYVSKDQLTLTSYKEYIELFARCLRETMETKEGVSYLLKRAGFEISQEDINLYPEWRWNQDQNPQNPSDQP